MRSGARQLRQRPGRHGAVTAAAELGRNAETAVADFLCVEGFSILERNVRLGPLERDVVARKGPLLGGRRGAGSAPRSARWSVRERDRDQARPPATRRASPLARTPGHGARHRACAYRCGRCDVCDGPNSYRICPPRRPRSVTSLPARSLWLRASVGAPRPPHLWSLRRARQAPPRSPPAGASRSRAGPRPFA